MTVIWTERAAASLQGIFEYVAAEDYHAALTLIDTLIDGTERVLGAQPKAGRPGRVEGTREWVAHRSYIVAYRVKDGSGVEVLDVIHSARLWPEAF